MSFPFRVDPSMPPDQIDIIDENGRRPIASNLGDSWKILEDLIINGSDDRKEKPIGILSSTSKKRS